MTYCMQRNRLTDVAITLLGKLPSVVAVPAVMRTQSVAVLPDVVVGRHGAQASERTSNRPATTSAASRSNLNYRTTDRTLFARWRYFTDGRII